MRLIHLVPVLFLIFSLDVFAQDPAELPPITVVAPTTDGGNIVCMGSGCASVLSALNNSGYNPFYKDHLTPEDGEGNSDADRARFCSKLKKDKPKNCTVLLWPTLNYPSAPGFDPNWSPNGCGTGAIANAIAGGFLNYLMGNFHTMDEPYEGISFRSACNSHDLCFGTIGSTFSGCNSAFRTDMNSACGSTYGCKIYADVYHFAVSTDKFGKAAFKNSQAASQCASWAKQMELNRCKF